MNEASSEETEPAGLRSRAWLACGIWDCDQGLLELSNRRLRFVTESGEVRLDVDLTQCSVRLRRPARTGLTVKTPSSIYRFWFSNPYLGLGAFTGAGPARATVREWLNAVSPVR